MIKKISDKDQKDWENFIKSSDKLENKDIENDNLITNNEKTLDLHGFNLRDANIAVGKLIISSYNQGVKKINIIWVHLKNTLAEKKWFYSLLIL